MEADVEAGRIPADGGVWPSPSAGWYAMGVFCVALMFAQLDLGVINLLVTPIKHDLGLNDFQMSLLQGPAFIFFYTFIGLPLSRFVDTRSRKHILAAGIAVWSIATACCGVARGFWQLFMARVMIGAGEAINGPATYSMIADFFPRDKLARPFAVLQIGFISGQGLSLLLGAFVIQQLFAVPYFDLPLVGMVHNWQVVFIVIGLPGILAAALMLTVTEPPRQGRPATAPRQTIQLRAVLRHLLAHKAVFAPMFIGLAFSAMNLYGIITWSPAFLQRTYGLKPQQAGLYLGVCSLVASPIGLIVGTYLNARFVRNGHDDANLRVLLWAQVIRLPAQICAPFMPTPELAVALYAMVNFASMMGAPSQNAALQVITPAEMRGQVTALYLFMFSVIGSGLGPTAIGALTTYVLGESHLNVALALASTILGPLSAFTLWTGLKAYRETMVRMRRGEA